MKRRSCLLPLLFLLAGCTEDPYGLLPTTAQIERLVWGPYDIVEGENPPGRNVVLVMRGRHYPEAGIVYRPVEIPKVRMTRAFGEALLARKARAGEVFSLLTSGAVGEAYGGQIVPRIPMTEIGEGARRIVEAENADRAKMIEEIRSSVQLPELAQGDIGRAFALARFHGAPEGIYIEERPGVWTVSRERWMFLFGGRGRDYGSPSPAPSRAATSPNPENR